MKIILLKPMAVAGHPNAHVGDVLEVPANTFQTLEGLGGARLADASDGVTGAPEVIETREPEIESRDPQPAETPPGKPSKRTRTK